MIHSSPRAVGRRPVVLMLLVLAAWQAQAATAPVIYPAKGQSAQQQDQDRYACHGWARAQAGGYDPTQVPATVAPAPTTTAPAAGTPAGGMAAGAMGGAAIAELTDHDAGRAAAAGALGGGLVQRVRQNQAAQQQTARQQAAQQQALQQQRGTYERALGACMEGRGYTVR